MRFKVGDTIVCPTRRRAVIVLLVNDFNNDVMTVKDEQTGNEFEYHACKECKVREE